MCVWGVGILPRVDRQFDIEVGRKIKEVRLAVGLSQTALADALGITYQQFAKYERGVNRISAAQIHLIASVLQCPIGTFFESLPQADFKKSTLEAKPTQPVAA